MTNNGKEAIKKRENVYKKKINGSLYLIMEERNKIRKGRENGRRGRNNQIWIGLEQIIRALLEKRNKKINQ